MVNRETFLTIGDYSKFSVCTPDEVDRALIKGAAKCPERAWMDRRIEGIMLYAAHLLECEWQQRIQTAGAATAIAQGQGGGLSFQTTPNLDRTIYGQQFAQMQAELPTITGFIV